MTRWIIALIIGLVSSLILMTLLTAEVIQTGSLGQDLIFTSFFTYTGGSIFLENASNSIPLFIATTIYYLIFFTFIGFMVGLLIEWLLKITRP